VVAQGSTGGRSSKTGANVRIKRERRVAKFPNSPGIAALSALTPAIRVLAAGSTLARVYYARSPYPQSWDQLRYFGPLNSRWDHHVPDVDGNPQAQQRGIYYAAADAKTCLAEVFQVTRRIDRVFQAPWLVVFETSAALKLLDLTGDFATRMGASMAIHSGSRGRARDWARDLYDAYPEVQGILYAASMHGGQPAIALNERALMEPLFPQHPLFHRALSDDVMVDVLKHAARALGYALR
jgi:RES domain-containing protein